jgi:hypothetical protein
MGRACSTHGGDELWVQKFSGWNRRVHLGNLGLDWKIILKLIFKK